VEDNEQRDVNQREVDFRVFMSETIIYRQVQTKKLDELISEVSVLSEKINALPCKERAGIYVNINDKITAYSDQVRTLWVFVTAIILSLVGTIIVHFFHRPL